MGSVTAITEWADSNGKGKGVGYSTFSFFILKERKKKKDGENMSFINNKYVRFIGPK